MAVFCTGAVVPKGKYYLECFSWDSGRNATIVYDADDTEITASVSGGSGTDWSGAEWWICQDGEEVKLPVGTVITFSYTGTYSDSSYADYGHVARTNSFDEASGTELVHVKNTAANKQTYTVTEPCYFFFSANIGNSTSSSLKATISITEVLIDGEAIWAKEV